MSDKKDALPRAMCLGSIVDEDYGANGKKLSTSVPFLWICANRVCRQQFMRFAYHSEYCPDCLANLAAGRGDLLDPVMYALCQGVIRLEDKQGYKGELLSRIRPQTGHGLAGWRRLIGIPELESDKDADHSKMRKLPSTVGIIIKGHKRDTSARKPRTRTKRGKK